jgi:hypothetical protein
MTENKYEFTNQIYDQNITSTMSNSITRDIDDDIYNLNDINKISKFLINAGLEDHRTLSDKWDIYVTCNADIDSDPSELYSRFINELYQQHINKKKMLFIQDMIQILEWMTVSLIQVFNQ